MKKINKIHRFIFNHLKSEMVQLTYEEPVKMTAKIKDMTWVFRCSDGRDYFMWNEPKEMPIRRQLEFISVFNQFILKFSDPDIKAMFSAMDAGMKETKPDIGLVLFCIEEFKSRQESTFFHKELLYHLFAICLINIDESIDQLTPTWKREKVALFEHDFENGLQDAVYNSPLLKFIPQLKNMDDFLTAFIENGNIELMALNQTLTNAANGNTRS
jgi:hypothetical protein